MITSEIRDPRLNAMAESKIRQKKFNQKRRHAFCLFYKISPPNVSSTGNCVHEENINERLDISFDVSC
jgi:hypothetical protein